MVLERELGINDYTVHSDNTIKIFSHLDSVGKINTLLNSNGIEVEKIGIKGQKLEDYFINAIGGANNV